MVEIIDKLPNWIIISLFILIVVLVFFILTIFFIAIKRGRELKIGPVSIGKQDFLNKERKSKYERTSWKILENEVIKIKEKLISEQYIPSLIVGIGRGGAVVGSLLSGCLGSIPIIVIDRIYNWDENGRKDKMLFDNINLKEYNDKVLLVAGELHTGNTARMYKEYFLSLQSKEVKIYTFFKEKFPACQPDYFSIEDDKADTILPWMITENYKRQSLKK